MARLVVIDLVFRWPPDGGAKIDLVEVLNRLTPIHDVHLVIPKYDRYYVRGHVETSFDFVIHTVPFRAGEYNLRDAPRLIQSAVAKLSPDIVWIADGDALKPYIAQAFLDYPLIYRFYSYESLCLKSYGVRYRNNHPCIGHSTLVSPVFCAVCGFHDALTRNDLFHLEALWNGRTFLLSYKETVLRVLQAAKSTIVSNLALANELAGIASGIRVIPGGVNIQRFTNQRPRPDQNSVQNGTITIGMVGRADDPIKGFEILKQAVRVIIADGIKVRLLVTSKLDFPEASFIQPVGWVQPDNIAALYQEMDVCVVPSLWDEPFGLVALEAMAAGKPLIVTDRGGLVDIVRDGVNGLIVAAGAIDELVSALRFLINSPMLRMKIGRAARETVETSYNWDFVVKQHYLPMIANMVG